MRFFYSIEDFTHFARFYGVPCYFNVETGELAGTNIVFDYLLLIATVFHNHLIERAAQFIAAISNSDYEPGFPIKILEINSEAEEDFEN